MVRFRFRLSSLTWGLTLASAVKADFVSTDYDGYNDGDLGHRPHLEFHSSDEFTPVLQASVWNQSAISDTGSHIFIKHDGNTTSPLSSPLILDANDLSAVYLNRSFENVFGTRVQENRGKKYLTFWEGQKGNGIGDGYGLAFDETYRLVYKISAQNIKVHSDLHEFAFTGNGTALVTGVDKVRARGSSLDPSWKAPSYFGILNAIFQEIDLETNEVLFDWRALDHINPMESHEPRGMGWDAYHLNSIEKTKAGNYLISMRHTHSIMLIDGQSGEIIWTLGGRRNDFVELSPADGMEDAEPVLSMAWQHHARFVPGTDETEITLFDNHVEDTSHGICDTECSRGLHIAVNTTASPPNVRLLREFQHPSQLQAQSQGSVQVLSHKAGDKDLGNVFIGWGRCPTFTEHSSTGETVMDVQFSPWHSLEIPDALDNYRAYKMDWVAEPWWDPSIALRMSPKGELVVYVSWNGATEVAEWVVKGIEAGQALNTKGQVVTRSVRTGFETKLIIVEEKKSWRYIWAEAMDADGNTLRSSQIVDLEGTSLPIAVDAFDESNSTFAGFLAAEKALKLKLKHPRRGLSKTAIALLASGLSVAGVAIIAAGVFWWYRRRDYNRVEAEDFALESDKFALESDDSDVDGDEEENDDGQHDCNGSRAESQALVSNTEERGLIRFCK
ncbi:arylsulfotransferase [Penicillium odoratum]|uniref:arylsulfotransferase n=1 Tax=Penicillium odoratum TaxID=1167516 RepID=UPI00254838CC|nr:arylsulfotransferase [Penicillium odoratum]KAJ5745778.1 arylsulfotransferase [Penicillium odoratum]